jgi:putative transposase
LAPNKQGECWLINFMRQLSRHQPWFRTFNVIEEFNLEALDIDMVNSLPAGRMSRYLDKLAHYRAYPLKLRVVNCPEFTGNMFTYWAKSHGITIDDI